MANWFASPALLWLGLLIGPLLLLYMLRHKPVRKRVPSIVLWTGVAQSQIATSPFQRLRRSLSLLLMLLALTALVLALSGLRVPGGEKRGVPLTVIIDVTASMNASETGGLRIDLARQRAEEVIDAAGNSDVSLFAWDGNLHAQTPADGDPAVAVRALNQLEPAHYGASDSALVRTLDQLTKDANRRVVLVSDHSPGQIGSAFYVQAGQPKMNIGVVSASLSETTSSQIDLFFGLDLSGSDKPVRVPLILERMRQDGTADLVDARDLDMQPGRRNSVTFSGVEPGLYAMRVKLEDALELDNVAWLRLSRLPVQDVVITGTAPPALLRAVEAIQEANQVIRLLPAGTEDRLSTSYVFTDMASSGAEPRLPSAYLAPEAAPRDVRYGETTDVAEAATRPVPCFLWRGAGTPDLRIPKVYEVETSRYLKPVLEAGTGPAIVLTTRDNDLHDLLIAFPLDETATGFSGRVAFLIFWANWFDYVRRAREPLPRGAVGTRQTVNLKPLAGRQDFKYGRLDAPDREDGSPGRALQFDQTGVYIFEGLDDTDLPLVGVSLLDANESDLSLPDPVGYDVESMRVWMRDFDGQGERRDLNLRPWLALLAGVLLLFDWYWFRRKFPNQTEPAPPAPKTQTAIRRNKSRMQS
jgi:hypothetical protein